MAAEVAYDDELKATLERDVLPVIARGERASVEARSPERYNACLWFVLKHDGPDGTGGLGFDYDGTTFTVWRNP